MDGAGRFVVPKDIRSQLGIETSGDLMVSVENGALVVMTRMEEAQAQVAFGVLKLPMPAFSAVEVGLAQSLVRRHRGTLSLADCACIATARLLAIPVVTADQIWATLPLQIEVRLIRP